MIEALTKGPEVLSYSPVCQSDRTIQTDTQDNFLFVAQIQLNLRERILKKMADTKATIREKAQARHLIETHTGPLFRYARGRDLYASSDDSLLLSVTYSQSYDNRSSPQFWYAVSPTILTLLQHARKAFVVFVMGRCSNLLIVPAAVITRAVAGRSTTGYGYFALHVRPTREGMYEFHEVPGLELTGYHNNFSLLTA